jgi:hypothetical protein
MSYDRTVLAFLSLLEADIETYPERLQAMSPEMVKRMDDLIEGMVFDSDEPIEGDVDF